MKRTLYFFIGLFCAVAASEVVLRALPVTTGYANLPVNAANPVLRGTPGAKYIYSKGWNFRFVHSGTLNDDGYIGTSSSGSAKKKILLIGNSYVEAAAIDPERNLASVLSKSLVQCEVLALGKSGDTLADYVARSDWSVSRYHPEAVIFLLVENDVRRSYESHQGGHYFKAQGSGMEIERADWPGLAGLSKRIAKLSVFRYFWDNLHLPVSFPKLRDASAKGTSRVPAEDISQIDRATNFALARLQDSLPKSRFLFLIDAKRTGAAGQRDIDRFADLAELGGFQVLRLQDSFDSYQRANGLWLDLRPIDAHWNVAAQAVAAEATLPRIAVLLGSYDPHAEQCGVRPADSRPQLR
jgi:hypothetical protein